MRQGGRKWFYRRVTIYDKGVTKTVTADREWHGNYERKLKAGNMELIFAAE